MIKLFKNLLLTLCLLALPLQAFAVDGAFSFGKTTNGTSATAASADYKYVSSGTMGAVIGKVVTGKARVWVASTSTTAKMIIYSGITSTSTLLAVSDEVSLTGTSEAEITFPFSGANLIALSASTAYGIGVHFKDPGATNYSISRANTTALTKRATDTYSDGPASTYGTTTDVAGAIDAYITYNSAPTVTTQATTITGATISTGNGNITVTGGVNSTERGFVYSTSTHGAPGNVAPASSGYSGLVNETGGNFSTGAFTESLTGLSANTAYYGRAYSYNGIGYSYGDEVTWTTLNYISTLVDNFNDNSIDAAKWNTVAGCAETNQQAEITSLIGGEEVAFWSVNRYDLTGSSTTCKIVDAGNQSLASYSYSLILEDSTESYYPRWRISGGDIAAWDINSSELASATYVAATHKYLKIRESGGTIYFDYSANGTDWTNFTSCSKGVMDITSVKVGLRVYSTAELSTTTAKVDSFNILPSATLTGTATASITEADIVTGGKTIILTLTGDDTWIAAGAASFDLQRQNIINGIDSAQSEATGWDLVPKLSQSVTGVVRTSDTVVTITLDAFATYNITATETITATIPATALVGGTAIVAAPTFNITASAAGGYSGWVVTINLD